MIAANPHAETDWPADRIVQASEKLIHAVTENIKLASMFTIDLMQVTQEIKSRTAVVLENGHWVPLIEIVEISSGVAVTAFPISVIFTAKGPDRQEFKASAVIDLERTTVGKLAYRVCIVGHA